MMAARKQMSDLRDFEFGAGEDEAKVPISFGVFHHHDDEMF